MAASIACQTPQAPAAFFGAVANCVVVGGADDAELAHGVRGAAHYGCWQKFFLDQFHLDLKLTNLKQVLRTARKLVDSNP